MIAAAEDPGRVDLIGYACCHIPIVFGIIVAAAGDEIAIAHPGDEVATAEAALILGGPALYLFGHSLFKLAVSGHLSPSRLARLCALGALVPLAVLARAFAHRCGDIDAGWRCRDGPGDRAAALNCGVTSGGGGSGGLICPSP